MKARKTCYSIRDIKIICKNCGEKLFAHKPPYNEADYICPYCERSEVLDLTEEKEWYGSYDSRRPIYDCFYLNNTTDYIEVEEKFSKIFKTATFEDASDGIHGSRLGMNLVEDIDVYRKIIVENGLALVSLNFGLFMIMEQQKAKEFIDRIEEKMIKKI